MEDSNQIHEQDANPANDKLDGQEAKSKPDVRIYLEEKVFPILTNGLEELLIAIEENKKHAEEENAPEFNPLYFLARYLMKHAPQNSQKSQKSGLTRSNNNRARKSSQSQNKGQENEPKQEEEDSQTTD